MGVFLENFVADFLVIVLVKNFGECECLAKIRTRVSWFLTHSVSLLLGMVIACSHRPVHDNSVNIYQIIISNQLSVYRGCWLSLHCFS